MNTKQRLAVKTKLKRFFYIACWSNLDISRINLFILERTCWEQENKTHGLLK